VGCTLTLDVASPATVVASVAVARDRPGRVREERLRVTSDGTGDGTGGHTGGGTGGDGTGDGTGDRTEVPVRELPGRDGALLHVVRAPVGRLRLDYDASVELGAGDDPEPGPSELDLDQLDHLRPSRYCPSDHVVGLALAEFGGLGSRAEQLAAVRAYVHRRVAYVSGSSTVHDSAEHTLLTGQGVCRDFAHLGVLLCRAVGIPARFASAYAPGLSPMDFHAVFEAYVDGRWQVTDATGLAPRTSMVRIATGRDAADTALLDVLGGLATLTSTEVRAVADGGLPSDDPARVVVMP